MAYNALVVGHIRPADVVVILGPGPIGLMAAQIARLCGASAIVLAGLERDAAALAIGPRDGRTHTVDLAKDGVAALVRDLTDGARRRPDCGRGRAQRHRAPRARPRAATAITKIAWAPSRST